MQNCQCSTDVFIKRSLRIKKLSNDGLFLFMYRRSGYLNKKGYMNNHVP